jgi:hypothetical protein
MIHIHLERAKVGIQIMYKKSILLSKWRRR